MLKFPKEYIEALAFECAKEYPLRIVVADNQVEWFRKAYGDGAIIIPLSETLLPEYAPTSEPSL